jgi:peptide chain release factor 1
MKDKILSIIKEYDEIEKSFLDPDTFSDIDKMKELGKKKSKIESIALIGKKYIQYEKNISESEELLEDPEMKDLAMEEILVNKKEKEKLEVLLKEELTPKDENDPKDIILEIRSGAGGEEAGIFAGDLMRMYFRFAEKMKFDVEIMNKSENENGGVSELVAEISGKNVYKYFKYEMGVHRVQRIPKTESQGRVHTSTVTVAVVPEVDDTSSIEINKADVRVDTYRSSGAGGQHVNKTESAIRLTHKPSGLVVTCQDGRSQLKNKEQAFKVLASRLEQIEKEKAISENSELRVAQIGTGDRSEKIRTYNYPQDRITDHRIKKNFSNIPIIMSGEIDGIIEACALANDSMNQG